MQAKELGTSYEILRWMNHKLESRLPGKISITSDMQMTPPSWQNLVRNPTLAPQLEKTHETPLS